MCQSRQDLGKDFKTVGHYMYMGGLKDTCQFLVPASQCSLRGVAEGPWAGLGLSANFRTELGGSVIHRVHTGVSWSHGDTQGTAPPHSCQGLDATKVTLQCDGVTVCSCASVPV